MQNEVAYEYFADRFSVTAERKYKQVVVSSVMLHVQCLVVCLFTQALTVLSSESPKPLSDLSHEMCIYTVPKTLPPKQEVLRDTHELRGLSLMEDMCQKIACVELSLCLHMLGPT